MSNSISTSVSQEKSRALAEELVLSSSITYLAPKDNPTFTGTTTVTGDLVIQGTTTTVNDTQLTVTDSMIQLAKGNTAGDVVNIGLFAEYNTGSVEEPAIKYTGLIRDSGDKAFKFIKDATSFQSDYDNETGTSLDFNDLNLADVHLKHLRAKTITTLETLSIGGGYQGSIPDLSFYFDGTSTGYDSTSKGLSLYSDGRIRTNSMIHIGSEYTGETSPNSIILGCDTSVLLNKTIALTEDAKKELETTYGADIITNGNIVCHGTINTHKVVSEHYECETFSIGTALVLNDKAQIIGDINGVKGNITGSVTGSVGYITGLDEDGNIVSSGYAVNGNINGSVSGSVGSVLTDVEGSVNSVTQSVGSVGQLGVSATVIHGNVNGHISGSVGEVASVKNNVGKNVVGDVLGNVYGYVGSVGDPSNTTGNVIHGNINGDIQGNILGSVNSVTNLPIASGTNIGGVKLSDSDSDSSITVSDLGVISLNTNIISGISANTSDITANKNELSTGISTNASDITVNKNELSTGISANTSHIIANKNELSTGISENTSDITANKNELSTGISANTSDITVNKNELSIGISANASDITANKNELSNSISANATNIGNKQNELNATVDIETNDIVAHGNLEGGHFVFDANTGLRNTQQNDETADFIFLNGTIKIGQTNTSSTHLMHSSACNILPGGKVITTNNVECKDLIASENINCKNGYSNPETNGSKSAVNISNNNIYHFNDISGTITITNATNIGQSGHIIITNTEASKLDITIECKKTEISYNDTSVSLKWYKGNAYTGVEFGNTDIISYYVLSEDILLMNFSEGYA